MKMSIATRDRFILRLAEDFEYRILSDSTFRAEICAERFRGMTDEELRQAASDAGIEGLE